MNKLPIINVYTDMAYSSTGFEKNQIAELESLFSDVFTRFGEQFSCAGYFFLKNIAEGNVYKSGAINTRFTQATEFIGCTFPGKVVF